MTVLVDTSALFALLDADDVHHAAATRAFAGLDPERRAVTHSYVVSETFALTARRLGPPAALALADGPLLALDVVWVDEPLHRAGLERYRREKGSASLVDHVSFELMKRQGIKEALAFDRDFEVRGYGRPADRPGSPRLSEARVEYGIDGQGTFVGVAEIARRIDVRPDTVHKWRMRHPDFPDPIADLAAGPVWRWADLEKWLTRTGRRGTGDMGRTRGDHGRLERQQQGQVTVPEAVRDRAGAEHRDELTFEAMEDGFLVRSEPRVSIASLRPPSCSTRSSRRVARRGVDARPPDPGTEPGRTALADGAARRGGLVDA